jgi:shikimate kinase
MSSTRGAHIVLVGLPGAGKSSIGRALSRRLRWQFVDFDTEIAQRAGKSVARIFDEDGEAAFRRQEVALTRDLVGAPASVLAPGGGWIVNPGVVELLRPPSALVYLRISTTAAMRRLRRSRTVRPLLRTPDPLASLEGLLAQRGPLYAQADLELNVESIGNHEVIENLVALARDLTGGIG